MIIAYAGETRTSLPMAYLQEELDGQPTQIICKCYASPDGSKLRISLPELRSFKQARIDIDSHLIEFERNPK